MTIMELGGICMTYVYSFLLALFLLFIIFTMTSLNVFVHFIRRSADDKLEILIKAWYGLIKIKYDVPVIQLSEDFSGIIYETEIESAQEEPIEKDRFKLTRNELFQLHKRATKIVKRVHALHQIMKRFFKSIRLQELQWYSRLGTGEAAETGVLTGLGWSIKSTIIGCISHLVTLRSYPSFNVIPSYYESRLETELRCMFRFRIGHAILAGIRILLNLRKKA